jgi:hypothetical protein
MSGFLLVLVHAFKGYTGWLNPAGWHSGLPPISLVAFVILRWVLC